MRRGEASGGNFVEELLAVKTGPAAQRTHFGNRGCFGNAPGGLGTSRALRAAGPARRAPRLKLGPGGRLTPLPGRRARAGQTGPGGRGRRRTVRGREHRGGRAADRRAAASAAAVVPDMLLSGEDFKP